MIGFCVRLLVALMLMGASAHAAQTPPASGIEGNWNAQRTNPGAASGQASITFTRNGTAVTGRLRSGSDEYSLFDVQDAGGRVSFTLVIPGTPYVTVHYAGTRSDTAMNVASADDGNGVYRLNAQRVGPPPPPPARPAAQAAAPAERPQAAPPARPAAPPAPPPQRQAQAAPQQAAPQAGPGVPAYIARLLGQPAATGPQQAAPPPAAPPPPPPPPPQRTASVQPPPQRPAAPLPPPPAIRQATPEPAPAARPAAPPPPRAVQPVAPPPVPRIPGIEGEWTAQQTAPGASPVAATLTFVRKEGVLSGTMHLGVDDLPLFEVRQAGGSVSFMLVIPGTPYVSVRYVGTLMGNTLELASIDDAGGTYKLTAQRTRSDPPRAEAPAPPPPAEPAPQLASLAPPPPPAAVAPPPPSPPAAEPVIAPPPSAPPPIVRAEPAPSQPARPAGPAKLDGKWNAKQSSPGSAAPVDATLTFFGVAGTMRVGADDWPLFEVKQTGRNIAFTLVIPGTPYITIHYRGTLTGDDLQAASIDENQGGFMLDARREDAGGAAPAPQVASLVSPPRTQPAAPPAAVPVAPPRPAAPPPVIAPPPAPAAPAPAIAAPAAPNVAAVPPGLLLPPQPATPLAAAPAPQIASAAPPAPEPPPPPRRRVVIPGPPPEKLPLPLLADVAPNPNVLKTPPVGWASRQRLGDMIDEAAIRQAADGLEETGLKAVGYTYVEVDDGWQGDRDAMGRLQGNEGFPNMKALADYIHGKGLKFGLLTSAAPQSCGGFTGSYGHETEDAQTFAQWGIDVLVYDWCGTEKIYPTQTEQQAAYQKMAVALKASGRNIAFAVSQNGDFNVASWASRAGANLWRTGKDIDDKWATMIDAGLALNGKETFSGPGRWNDPGLIQVGNGGMTPDEYRTHLNLWAVLGAPMVLGNDVRIMRKETVDLLSNKEVIAVDQDPLGKQGRLVLQTANTSAWAKPLADGSVAVVFVNRGTTSAPAAVSWDQLGIMGPHRVRDVWWHENIGTANNRYAVFLTPHTSLLLVLSPN